MLSNNFVMMSEALLALSYYVIMLCKETLALELPKVAKTTPKTLRITSRHLTQNCMKLCKSQSLEWILPNTIYHPLKDKKCLS